MHHYRYRQNHADEDGCQNTLDFPCAGFWLAHILGGIFIFSLGMKFALRRAPLLPIVLYRLLRGTAYK